MQHETSHVNDAHHYDDHAAGVHVVPLQVLAGIFVALLALTYVTVAVTSIDLGSFNLWIALGVATVKGALVVLYFMHLRYDSPFNSIVFITAFVFLFLFLGIVIMDSVAYQPAVYELTPTP